MKSNPPAPRWKSVLSWMRAEGSRSVAHQLRKRISLEYSKRLNLWQRLQRRSDEHWTEDRANHWLAEVRTGRFLVGPRQHLAFRRWAGENHEDARNLIAWADAIRAGDIDLFDRTYRLSWNEMPWSKDWRTGKHWSPGYFRDFTHHAVANAGDVKFPWELSRMGWIIPLLEASALSGDHGYRDCALDGIGSWEEANPIAYTVNWHPMECAMRILNLALGALIAGVQPTTEAHHVIPLLRQISLNAEFLSRNIEYTRLRSNHYAANLGGLAIAGHVLNGYWGSADRLRKYAFRRTPDEILQQFHPDGVQFEGSVAYHRLVTELFLVTALVMGREGVPMPRDAAYRLHKACRFTACYLRPDHLAPNWGDNDGARVLCFERRPIADHRALICLGAEAFEDSFLRRAGGASAAAAWLGSKLLAGGEQEDAESVQLLDSDGGYFRKAGILICRSGGTYLFADYGGVGLRGRGGHGHNDTFSFELCLHGQPVVVDPGSPAYTGDLALYDRYRSTASHNTLQVDEEEMAPMPSIWRIDDDARPRDVVVSSREGVISISGQHGGYRPRGCDLVHERTLELAVRSGRLVCKDTVRGVGRHRITRYLHLAPGVRVENITDARAEIWKDAAPIMQLQWSDGSEFAVVPSRVSPMFGSEVPAFTVSLTLGIVGSASFEFVLTTPEATHAFGTLQD